MNAKEFRLPARIPGESWPLTNWAADRSHGLDNLDGISQLSSFKQPPRFELGEPHSIIWTIFSPGEDRQHVILKLLRDSWAVFKHIRLETWVERAIELPAVPLVAFETFHDRLAFSLFTFLRRFPHETTKYDEVAQAIGRTDYFLHQSVRHALEKAEAGSEYQRFQLDASLIVDPLKSLVCQPDKRILVRLTALEVRYRRFCISSEFARGERFSVDTPFLALVFEHPVGTAAERLTKAATERFSVLSIASVADYKEPIRLLGNAWDQLSQDARELAAVVSSHENLILLCKRLLSLDNFFSLTAILTGLQFAGVPLEPVLADFIDPSDNHRMYRLHLHREPSLPFLYPLIIDLRRGNDKALKAIFSFLTYDLAARVPSEK